MKQDNKARLKLLGVFSIFIVPLTAAYVLYYGLSYGSAGTNQGVLVEPAQPLPELTLYDRQGSTVPGAQVFDEKWTILQVAADDCGSACRQSLDETRQIRALLHRRVTRVQRVLLLPAESSIPQFDSQPDLAVYRTDTKPLARLFEQQQANSRGVVYLIDPLGNWMLYYPEDGDGEALFEDIKHLLKLSHIG